MKNAQGALSIACYQSIGSAFFDRETFVYDTEPACRAVAVVRAQRGVLALTYLAAVQEAFYSRNGDVTQPSELQRLAEGLGVDGTAFAAALAAPEMRAAVAQEFAAMHDNVDYFPSYELVSYADPKASWAWDYRHVSPDLVAHIMSLFKQHYVDQPAAGAST